MLIVIRCLSQSGDNAKSHVIATWAPTEDNLSIYTINQLEALAIATGAKDKMEANDVGSFDSLFKSKKGDIIKAIPTLPVNWVAYAPPSLISLIEQ